MLDYVKNATAHYGTVFKTRSVGLSKIKITEKEIAEDAENARQKAVNHSSDTDLIFLNNRMTHTNKLNGYRRTSQPFDATNPGHTSKTPVKPKALVKTNSNDRDLVKTI
jgi:hypothetical protein